MWFLAVAFAAPRDVVLPMSRLPSGHYAVDVDLNGKRTFLLDTGAEMTVVDQRIADQLRTKTRGKRRAAGFGGTADLDVVNIDLRLDGQRYHDVPAAVADLSHLDLGTDEPIGILGLDVLSLHVMELDFADNRLVLHPRGEEISGELEQVGWTTSHGLVLDAEVGGRALPAFVDTGAVRSSINWAAAETLGYDAVNTGAVVVPSMGVATDPVLLGMAELPQLEIGPFAIPNHKVAVLDTASRDGAALNVGLETLRTWPYILVDFDARALSVGNPRPTRGLGIPPVP